MRTVYTRNTRSPWPFAGAILVALALVASSPGGLLAQAGTQGQWRTLTNQAPINPIHVALMNNGEVLIVAGSGNLSTETFFQAAVWDPLSETFQTQSLAWDMFCNGMVVLHDGRVFINGGNLQYDPFFGERRNAVFDPATHTFTNVQNMAHGRWYPTVTTLGDGRVMTFSGLRETGGTNTAVEIYTVGSGWSPEIPGWLDAAAISAHAPEHGWPGLLRRRGSRLQSSIRRRIPGRPVRRHHELRRAGLRHVGPAPPDAGERL